MSAVGFASMPVVPSLQGMRAVLEKQLQGPLSEASKKAGDTLSKGLTDGVERASKDVARARKAEADAATAVAQAEDKVTDARGKAEVKAKSVEQAELALQAARLSSKGAVEKAEQSLAKLRESGTASTEELTTAERKLEQVRAAESSKVLGKENALERARQGATKATKDAEKATTDLTGTQAKLADAQDNVTAAAKRLENAQDGAESSTSKLKTTFGDAEGAANGFDTANVKLAASMAAIVGAAAASVKGLYDLGSQFDDMFDTIRIGTGASGDAFAGLQDSATKVAQSVPAMDGGLSQIGTTMADLNTRLGATGQPLETLTGQFVKLTNMGIDADINDVSGALTQFNIEAADAPAALDDLFRISQASGRSITDITSNLSKSGPALQMFGFGLNESAGLLGALDKAGLDSEKTVGSMTKALSVFAKEGKDPQKALWGTIVSIDELSAAGKDMEAVDLANKLFGAKGGAGFVAAVQSGKFEYDGFLDSIGASGDTIDGVFAETMDFAEHWELFKQQMQVELAPIGQQVFGALSDGMVWVKENGIPALRDMAAMIQNNVIPAFQVMGQWVQDNRAWLEPLAVAVGAAAAAWGLWVGAIKTWQMVTKVATGIQVAFNAVMAANPIMLAVMAVAALVAGLTYFFMKTETGQAIWSSFMDGLSAAGDWLSTTFAPIFAWIADVATSAWEGIKAGWDTLASAFSTGWEWIKSAFAAAWGFISPIFTALKIGFAIVLTAALLFWEGIKLYWGLVADLFVWAWNTVIKPVWDGMQIGLQVLGSFFGWVWTALIQPAWNALGVGIAWVWDTVIRPVWDALKIALGAVGSFFQWVWNSVIKPVWDALGAGIRWVSDTIVLPVFEGIKIALGAVGDFFSWAWNSVIKPAWDALGNGIRAVVDNVVHPVFEGLKRGLGLIESAFSKAVDFIGITWDRIKAITAAPINFVIREVYMGGLRPAWEKVANLVGLDPLPEMKEIGGFAEGTARVPGARTRHDNVQMVSTDGRFSMGLRGGEGVAVPEVVDAVGERSWNALNEAGLHGGAPAVGRVLRSMNLGGHADGGIINLGGFDAGGVTNLAGALSEIQRSHAAFVGRFFPGLFNLTSASRSEPGSMHDFGSQSATDWQAKDGQFATQMPTPASKGLARAIAENFPNTTQLIHHPLDGWQNILNGGPFDYGPGTNAGHGNHVHWGTRSPLQFDGDDIVLSDIPGGAGGGISMASLAKTAWDKAIGLIPGFPGKDSSGLFGGVPGGFLEKSATSLWDFVKDKFTSLFSGGSGGGAEQWRDLARVALQRHGYDPDPYIDAMLQQIQIESTGDPNAINNWDSNALRGTPSAGLLQVIEPTYRDVRNKYPAAFEGLPDNRTEPLTNLVAGVGALRRDWGGPAGGRWPTTGGYHNGGLAPAGTGWMPKTALEPEFVLNPEMTKAFIGWMGGSQWNTLKSLVISTAELLDPLRLMARDGRDGIAHLEQIATATRRQVDSQVDAAGAAVWAALPGEVKDALTVAGAVGQQWQKVAGYLGEKAIAWSRGEWPIGSGRVVEQQAGPAWLAMHLDESLEKVARSNVDLAEQVIAGKVSPGNDPVANALFDIFGRDPILPDLARIAALGPNAIGAATDAALHAFETGETARLEEWTASNSQLTEAVLRARDAAIVTGEMVQGAVNGYLNWAMASDSQGRQGSWQEYFQHYGGEYGTAQGDWLLGQVGLGGILGGKLKDSAANLLIETAKSPLLSAPAILDSDGRVIGSKLDAPADPAQLDRSGYTTLTAANTPPAEPAAGKTVVIEVTGTHVPVEELEKKMAELGGEVAGVKFEVKRMQDQPADVTAGVSLMV